MAKKKEAAARTGAEEARRYWLRRVGKAFRIEAGAPEDLKEWTEDRQKIETDSGHATEAEARARFEVLRQRYRSANVTLEVM